MVRTRSGAGVDVNAGTERTAKMGEFFSTGTSLPTRAAETPQPGMSSPVSSHPQVDIGSSFSSKDGVSREEGAPGQQVEFIEKKEQQRPAPPTPPTPPAPPREEKTTTLCLRLCVL